MFTVENLTTNVFLLSRKIENLILSIESRETSLGKTGKTDEFFSPKQKYSKLLFKTKMKKSEFKTKKSLAK